MSVALFLPLAKTKSLPETELKSFRLVLLAEEISRQHSTDCHVVISDHSYADLQGKKEQRRQKEIQNVYFEEKKSPREYDELKEI